VFLHYLTRSSHFTGETNETISLKSDWKNWFTNKNPQFIRKEKKIVKKHIRNNLAASTASVVCSTLYHSFATCAFFVESLSFF